MGQTSNRPSYVLLALLILLAQASLLPLHWQARGRAIVVDTSLVPMSIGAWQGRPAEPFDQTTLLMLQPDAYVHRVYDRPDGASVVLSVIYGHRKDTFHSPGFCLLGGGWSIMSKGVVQGSPVGSAEEPVRWNRLLLRKHDDRAVVLYTYLRQGGATASWTVFQGHLLSQRLRGSPGSGALVRLVVPATGEGDAAERNGLAFLAKAYPALLRSLDSGGAGDRQWRDR
jgi:EpsI family protein